MEIKESEKPSNINRYWAIIKNGLFLFGLRNRLADLGIDILPYYWVQEEFKPCESPTLRGGDDNFSVRSLSLEEFKTVAHSKDSIHFDEMVKGMQDGQLCIALEESGEIAAYTFAELNSFDFQGRYFELKPNETYLLNMWTFHKYRGRGIAPYLRHKVYELLKNEHGIDVKYSITDYFNKSSIKFKNKLNSKNLYLYLSIVLFRKFKWNFRLKKY